MLTFAISIATNDKKTHLFEIGPDVLLRMAFLQSCIRILACILCNWNILAFLQSTSYGHDELTRSLLAFFAIEHLPVSDGDRTCKPYESSGI